MDNINQSIHLNLLQLYQNALNALSSKRDDVSEIKKEALNTLDSFMAYQPVEGIKKEKDYLSPISIFDCENFISYPLCFFKLQDKDDSIISEPVLPILNHAGIDFLKSLDIIFDEEFSVSDCLTWYTTLNSSIFVKGLSEKIKLIPEFLFFDKEILSSNSIFPFLRDYFNGKEALKKYDSLFKELADEETETQINENSFGFFAREQRTIQRLSTYASAKVSVEGDHIFHDYFWHLMDHFIETGENGLFVLPRNEKEQWESYLKENGLSDFSIDLGAINEQDYLFRIQNVFYHVLPPTDEIQIRKMNEKESLFLNQEDKRKSFFCYPKFFFDENMYLSSIQSYLNHDEYISLNIDDYQEEDSLKDKEFLNVFSSLETVKNSYIENHIFYGLSLSKEENSFNEFQNMLKMCLSSLQQVKEKIKSIDWLENYSLFINDFSSCQELIANGTILSQYNGFPRKYFRFNSSEQLDLTLLKKKYQAVSSSQLLLISLFGKEFFDEDFESLISLSESKLFVRRNRAKKILSQYAKNQKNMDLKTVVNIMKSYLSAKEELKNLLPSYKEVYGDYVADMNGVVEIESNVSYVKKFYARANEAKDFSLETPWVKHCIKEKSFRLKVVSDILELSSLYTSLMNSVQDLNHCFISVTDKFDMTMDFDAFENMLQGYLQQNYETYRQYAIFRDESKQTSVALQLMIRKKIAKKETFLHLREEFNLSLMMSFVNTFHQAFEIEKKDYIFAVQDYLTAIKNEKAYFYKEKYLSLYNRIEKEKRSEEYQALLDDVTREDALLTSEKNRKLFVLLTKTFPFSYICSDELSLLPDDHFDNIVMINSSHYSNMDLLNGYRVGQKLMFLAYGTDSDKRIEGLHETIINKDVLYYKQFIFADIKDALYLQLKTIGDVDVFYDEPEFPLIINYKGQSYSLIPSFMLSYQIDGDSMLELSKYLAREFNILLLPFDTYDCLYDQGDLIREIMV